MAGSGRIAGVVAVSLLLLVPSMALADGEQDPSFNGGAPVVTSFAPGGGSETASSLVPLSDGRLLAGGIENGFGTGVAQYLPDGTLDPGFGTGGKVVREFSNASFATGIARQPDGAIVAAGGLTQAGNFNTLLERFTSSGAMDTSFGNDPPNPSGDGVTVKDYGPSDFANGVALDGQGRIVTAGATHTGPPSDLLLARFNGDGSPDQSFNGSGRATANIGADDRGEAVATLPDGRILVAGESDGKMVVLRYQTNGTPDPGFGTNGIATVPGVTTASEVHMVLQPDGRIVVSATTNQGGAVARLQADGALDQSFANGGTYAFPLTNGQLGAVALADDGRIVLAASQYLAGPPTEFDLIVIRLLPSGALDSGFGAAGTAVYKTANPSFSPFSATVLPNRRIVIGGGSYNSTGPSSDSFVTRLLGDTNPPDTKVTKGPKRKLPPSKKVSFTFEQLNDVNSTFECKFQRPTRKKRHSHHRTAPATFKPCTSPVAYKGVRRLGRYTFSVRATDPAGNVDPTPAKRSFKVRKRHH